MGESSCFLSRAEELKRYIQGLDLDQARKLWQCNEKIALLNYGRFKEMDLERRLTPALLSYEGIQYQYMAPGVFEQGQWDYVQEHLRILSGFTVSLSPWTASCRTAWRCRQRWSFRQVSKAFMTTGEALSAGNWPRMRH